MLKSPRFIALAALVVLNAGVWYSLSFFHPGILKVYYLDVGQGDSILIEAPSGERMLIDGGLAGSLEEPLAKVLPFYADKIDVVLATHPDADHTGGLTYAIKRYSPSFIVTTGVTSSTTIDEEFEKAAAYAENKGISEHVQAERGIRIVLDKNVFFDIYFPDRDLAGLDMPTNETGIVGKLSYGSTAFIFTADQTTAVENYLASLDGSRLQSDVLKVAHHGSTSAISQSFYQAVLPKYSIISVGLNNSYHLPDQDVIDALSQISKVYRTDEDGTIEVDSDGGEVSMK